MKRSSLLLFPLLLLVGCGPSNSKIMEKLGEINEANEHNATKLENKISSVRTEAKADNEQLKKRIEAIESAPPRPAAASPPVKGSGSASASSSLLPAYPSKEDVERGKADRERAKESRRQKARELEEEAKRIERENEELYGPPKKPPEQLEPEPKDPLGRFYKGGLPPPIVLAQVPPNAYRYEWRVDRYPGLGFQYTVAYLVMGQPVKRLSFWR